MGRRFSGDVLACFMPSPTPLVNLIPDQKAIIEANFARVYYNRDNPQEPFCVDFGPDTNGDSRPLGRDSRALDLRL